MWPKVSEESFKATKTIHFLTHLVCMLSLKIFVLNILCQIPALLTNAS